MKRNNLVKLTSALLFSLIATISNAAVPNTINYQGFLTDATTGQPQTAPVSVAFKFYDAPTAGILLYGEVQTVTPTNGTFNVQIGSVSTFPATLVFDKPYWLEISVGTQVLSPRQPLASSATALRAKVADSLAPASGIGANNLAVGTGALQANTIGSENSASGVDALKTNTTGYHNSATGFRALLSNFAGNFNTASGSEALKSNTTGSLNTASGSGALYSNTTGNYNTASGSSALNSNTTGTGNSAIGSLALLSNTTGYYNSAIGSLALNANNSGNWNTAVGYSALLSNSNGSSNAAFGSNVLAGNTSGAGNVAVGDGSMYLNTIGNNNTAVGQFALKSNVSGSGNTAIGQSAGFNLTTGNNNIDIGNTGVAGESNIIRIGASQTATYLAGNVFSNGTFTNSSDRNLKENFAAVNAQEVLTKVASLPLQVWNYKQENPNTRHIGPMAQDFAAAFSVGADDKHIATVDESGVALAAIKGLYEKWLVAEKNSRAKDKKINQLARELAAIKAKLNLK